MIPFLVCLPFSKMLSFIPKEVSDVKRMMVFPVTNNKSIGNAVHITKLAVMRLKSKFIAVINGYASNCQKRNVRCLVR